MRLLHARSLLLRSVAVRFLCIAVFLAGALLPPQRVVRLGFLSDVSLLALWLLLLQELHYVCANKISIK